MVGSVTRGAVEGGTARGRRREEPPPKTVAEQIAERIALGIMDGTYEGGERLREVEIAAAFDVSRAPVREAIRALADWGFVTFRPRRGAHVIAMTPDAIADAFNTRAVLMGLAARMIALQPDPVTLEGLEARIVDLEQAIVEQEGGRDDPVAFARAVSRAGGAVARGCGSASLTDVLQKQVRHSIWGFIWRRKALDFHDAPRRCEAVAEWRALLAALRAGDGDAAERLQRHIHFKARDHALESLRSPRAAPLSPNRRLQAAPGGRWPTGIG